MATLLLGAAATAFSGAIGAGAFTSALISGAATVAGAYADTLLASALSPARHTAVNGPRIGDLRLQTSTEGAPLPDGFGRLRLAGQVIWATRLRMEVATSSRNVGGKGMGGGQKVTTTTYLYYGNFAIGICEGPIVGIGRIWADGKLLDRSRLPHRVYRGTRVQQPDPLIETKEGAAPAFRGTAYIVFEDLALEDFGNRIPQFEFEVFRRLGGVEDDIQGMVVIPGAGEWVYADEPVRKVDPLTEGASTAENTNNQVGGTDWAVALDNLAFTCPNVRSVLLVVAWFGTDLRCGHCEVRPGVEFGTGKETTPLTWSVHSESRETARVLSRDPLDPARPVYGGTPSDQTVVQAIRDLKARGYAVMLYPFILMDVPPGNGLPDPYGGPEQAAYPWRGRITCSPAAGQPGTVDKTAAAGAQVDALFGTALPGHISLAIDAATDAVACSYSGPAEWSLRRMVLHYAKLSSAVNAMDPGAVSAFVIGSEMIGLTQVRSSPSTYPAVSQLVSLAVDCKAILGGTVAVTYAADWPEYRGHDPADGSGDFFFHLDPLWSSAAIDAIAIDNYMKLSDWREGRSHLDFLAGHRSIYSKSYLAGNVEGGEDYDWFYANQADRDAQLRTPIMDAAGKPWVYRTKDFRNWWLNPHHDRPGGVESASPTGWVPQSKPILFTEYGFPSVDKATNQPNVFVDPKSSESAWPHYSARQRDDLIQRRGIQALLDYWAPSSGNNPVSAVYGGPMLDLTRSHLWTWDARPYPSFPYYLNVWSDGANWSNGHWVQGKFGVVELGDLIRHICGQVGFTAIDVSQLEATVTGWLRPDLASPRDQIEVLAQLYRFDAVESEGLIKFIPRGRASEAEIDGKDLAAPDRDKADWSITRAQETDLPLRALLVYWDAEGDYRQTSSASGRLVASSDRVTRLSAPAVIDAGIAGGMIEDWLYGEWAGREQARFALPPSLVRFDPADVVSVGIAGRSRDMRLTRIVDGGVRHCEAVSVETPRYHPTRTDPPPPPAPPPPIPTFGEAVLEVLDLPVLEDGQSEHRPWLAGFAAPWGGVRVQDGAKVIASLTAPATMGRTLNDLSPGTVYRFDRANRLTVKLVHGALSSVAEEELLQRSVNVLAVWNGSMAWEILQFATATLIAPGTFELSGLLRGRRGTAHAMRDPVPGGSRVVLLDGALTQADVPLSERGIPRTWAYGPAPLPSSDAAFRTRSTRLEAVGLKPFAPVHVRGRRTPAGNLNVTWIRQARVNAGWADGTDVPLGEERELYELDILSGGGVVRTVSGLMSPSHVYTAAEQTVDFGGPQSSIALRICQISALVGRGILEEVTL
ncbi:baseplate multidomain protein megatron [Pannonibacter carbonis]|uniref:baseplate multidomain protein megatron n=1 Tax=Pannonibacter carbonis TaxID=2067569 RepID=UPI000D0F3AE6|nr:glycoside hydrolase/phage tail family protein [Pannonibacter carbonis]